jgi:hypothetical protein
MKKALGRADGGDLSGRCGGDLAVLTVLPCVGGHPTYRILGCAACSFIGWIAEQIED